MLAISGLDAQAAVAGGFIPARLTHAVDGAGFVPRLLTPLTATLLHANLLHLALNLLMLVICGKAIEPAIGRGNMMILYLLGAVAAAGAQWAVDPASQVPMIGASGAISAVVGAYSLLFGQSRVRVSNPALARALHVAWLAAAWTGLQLLFGYASGAGGGPSIATLAHIGGFLCGLALAKPLYRLHWHRA